MQFEFDSMTIICVLGILVFCTNVIVEVIKRVFLIADTRTINIIALSISMLLSVISYFVYIEYTKSDFIWYYLLGSVIIGFIIALVAMIGWDKVLKMWMESKPQKEDKPCK